MSTRKDQSPKATPEPKKVNKDVDLQVEELEERIAPISVTPGKN